MRVRRQTVAVVVALFLLCSCGKDVADGSADARVEPVQHPKDRLHNIMSHLRQGKLPPNCEMNDDKAIECDGYVPPYPSDGTGATELSDPNAPPADWAPFEFNGETYYVRPLEKEHPAP